MAKIEYNSYTLNITGTGTIESDAIKNQYLDAKIINVFGYSKIGDSVFYGRSNLEQLHLDDSVTYIVSR